MVMPSFDEGLQYCEDNLIRRVETGVLHPSYGLGREVTKDPFTPSQIIMGYLFEEEKKLLTDFSKINQYFKKEHYPDGSKLFSVGDMADRIWIVQSGNVTFYREIYKTGEDGKRVRQKHRILHVSHGAIIGDVHFMLNERRDYTAETIGECEVYCFEREAMQRMGEEAPQLLNSLQVEELSVLILSC